MIPINAKTLADLQWHLILRALSERAKTDLGRKRGLAWPFFERAESINEQLAHIEELRGLARDEQLTLPLWGVHDVNGHFALAAKNGILEPSTLLDCANVLHALARVRDFLQGRPAKMPRSLAVAERIADLSSLANRIERSFEPNGELSDHASPTLFDLRQRARNLHRGIKNKLDQLLHDQQFTQLLRENYFTVRNERYVVPVLASARSQVPGIVHNASQSGQTLFVEPQPLISMGNELTIAQSMVQEEERRILQELSHDLGLHAIEVEGSLEACSELDALESAAKLAFDLAAQPVRIVPGQSSFKLLALRHPLLALQQKTVVPNDVGFGEQERVLVVSGPNAGGKTVTLSGVGLCALMLRAGLPIPAESGSTLPLFNNVESAIGDAQDLAKDLSTFSAHLTALRDIGKRAVPGTLILVDEIAADTDPREGAALAAAVLEDFAAKDTRVIVTTHLEELKALAVTESRYVNAHVGFDTQKMAPTYRLHYGTPGSSSAIEVARRVGLDPQICSRAEENLKARAGPLGQALAALEKKQHESDEAYQALQAERAALASQREQLEAQQQALRQRELALQTDGRRQLLAEVEQTRAQVAQLLAQLQARPSVREAVQTQTELSRVAQEEQKKLARQEAEAAVDKDDRLPQGVPITEGMRVKVPQLGEARVLEIDGDEAIVAAGPLKVRHKLKDLVPLRGQAKATANFKKRGDKIRSASAAAAAPLNYGANRVDVRGMRAEDALRAVETFLDRSYGEGLTGVTIIHGLGTGALRATIRDYLKNSPYVTSLRAGQEHEGGEGATLVQLKS